MLDGVQVDFEEKAVRPSPDDWRSLFHTYEETVNAPPITFAIEEFLQEEGVTLIGGLAGHGKTLVMLKGRAALGKVVNEEFATGG